MNILIFFKKQRIATDKRIKQNTKFLEKNAIFGNKCIKKTAKNICVERATIYMSLLLGTFCILIIIIIKISNAIGTLKRLMDVLPNFLMRAALAIKEIL